MAGFYTGLAATAEKLLESKGSLVTVTRANTSYDPVTFTRITESTSTQTLKGVLLSSSANKYDVTLPESEIQGRAASMILSTVGATYEPEPLDIVSQDGNNWMVYGVSSISPAGTPVIYKLGLTYKGVVTASEGITADSATITADSSLITADAA